MNALVTLFAVFLLCLIPVFGVGTARLTGLFGFVIPAAAAVAFIVGFCCKIYSWAKLPVPFRIPTTGGQQKTLDFMAHNPLDNPPTVGWTWLRMILEICCFRSLLRNTEVSLQVKDGKPTVGYYSAKWLWLAALMFHYSFLVIFLRHFRFFTDPVPFAISGLEQLDGIVQMLQPNIYLTDVMLVAGLCFVLGRRVLLPRVRYISMAQDYFPLFLILSIAISGIYMRYVERIDVASVKQLAMGIVTLHPVTPENLSVTVYVHLFLVSVLLVYFPFSKLMHMGGVFLSPTRNMANNSRFVHHENPWNPKVKPHSYEAYEDDFREPMAEAGLPLDKPL